MKRTFSSTLTVKKIQDQHVPRYLFWLYLYYIIDFFLRFSERIPAYGALRPTLILTVVIAVLLMSQKKKFGDTVNEPVFKTIKWLIIFLITTLPLVSYPGSVIKNNLPFFVKAVMFLYFTVFIITTEKRLRIFLFTFIVCQVFRVLEPLYLNITTGYWGSRTYIGEGEFAQRLAGGPYDVINGNGLGFVIVTIIPYLYYLLWRAPRISYKVIFTILLPVLIYTLVLTMSRGAFIALLVVVWMIFKESKNKFGIIVVVMMAMSVIWTNLSDIHKDRYLSLVSSDTVQSSSAQGRVHGMMSEFGVALERPIIGHGLGTSMEAKSHSGVGYQVAHNLYAEVLIEIGALGLIMFFMFMKSLYTKFKENMSKIKLIEQVGANTFGWRLNSALATVFWMYAIYSINYYGLTNYYWYMYAGLLVAFSRIYFTEKEKIQQKEALIDHEEG